MNGGGGYSINGLFIIASDKLMLGRAELKQSSTISASQEFSQTAGQGPGFCSSRTAAVSRSL